jgi:hypothetical protein
VVFYGRVFTTVIFSAVLTMNVTSADEIQCKFVSLLKKARIWPQNSGTKTEHNGKKYGLQSSETQDTQWVLI